MKKIFVCLLLFVLAQFMPQAFADSLDINYILQIAKSNNIDINEVMKRPYVGASYDSIKNGKKPYLIVFADFTDLSVAAKYFNNGYQVYNNVQNDYGFAAFNTKNSDNSALMAKFKVRTTPYVVIANPHRNEVVPIKSALYNNPDRLVYLLRAYLKRTR